MNDLILKRERKHAVVAVVGTVVAMPMFAAAILQGPQWVVLVCAMAFMVGYVVERIRLLRTITCLRRQLPASAGGTA